VLLLLTLTLSITRLLILLFRDGAPYSHRS
jgi:hypothetical protein